MLPVRAQPAVIVGTERVSARSGWVPTGEERCCSAAENPLTPHVGWKGGRSGVRLRGTWQKDHTDGEATAQEPEDHKRNHFKGAYYSIWFSGRISSNFAKKISHESTSSQRKCFPEFSLAMCYTRGEFGKETC